MINEELINIAKKASIEAGKKIIEIYNGTDFKIEMKKDKTPLTIADKNAHNTIINYLSVTKIPVLSEEGKLLAYEKRKEYKWLWLVDPLDGTKEFIKKNGEFTVNIALIHKNITVAGVIYVPTKKELYFSDGKNSYLEILDENYSVIDSNKLPITKSQNTKDFVIVASRSHLNEETKQYIEQIKKTQAIKLVSAGSSLKFCLVAKGIANIYPRFAPTMEWDTAAGHSIVKTAGYNVFDINTGKELLYNKKELLNPYFIVK